MPARKRAVQLHCNQCACFPRWSHRKLLGLEEQKAERPNGADDGAEQVGGDGKAQKWVSSEELEEFGITTYSPSKGE